MAKEMKIVAISPKGKEFMYRVSSAHKVTKASANKICDALNKANFRLKEGETWFVYDVYEYDRAYEVAQLQQFKVYKGAIREVGDIWWMN